MEFGEGVLFFAPPHPVVTKVVRITAQVPGTPGVRNHANKRPADVLHPSSSSLASLAGNPPVILVRGCNTVELEAHTQPPGKPVNWSVTPNENPHAAPAITPVAGGRKAKLHTNVQGSFSVTARVGATHVVWNVVFVGVRVLPKTTVAKADSSHYVDAGSAGPYTLFRSGLFVPGSFTWHAQVDVRVVGGGASGKLGIDRVKLHVLQNGVADTLTGHYPPHGTAHEVPKGGLPVRDSNDGTSPFVFVASCFKVTPNQVGVKRRVWTADSPAGGFPHTHLHLPAATLRSISGSNQFSTAIVSVSDEAPNSIVAHARIGWNANFAGLVSAAGIYTPHGARTTTQPRYVLISAATGGEDAAAAGLETFSPRFNEGTDTHWVP